MAARAIFFAYFNAFVNGDLEPTATHFWLLAGAIVGSLVVAAGIALEANWPISRMKSRELAGITFVFFGVSVEALFTLALFMFDEGLSSAQQKTISKQQSTIIGLDKALLNEQRITSRERMVLAWLVRATAPRNVERDRLALVAALKDKGLGSINIAYVDKMEPEYLATQMSNIFVSAGIMGKMIKLPSGVAAPGSKMYDPTPSGMRANKIIWEVTRMSPTKIAGGSAGIRGIGWESLPEGEDTLVIGENDAGFQPMDGQAGEGIDENGRPLPP